MIADTQSPFELIPIVLTAARAYDDAHPEVANKNKAIVHADDFCSWAWGVQIGRVPETRFEINADDGELEAYRLERHLNCIMGTANENTIAGAPATTTAADNVEVLKQLTASLARQTEEAMR